MCVGSAVARKVDDDQYVSCLCFSSVDTLDCATKLEMPRLRNEDTSDYDRGDSCVRVTYNVECPSPVQSGGGYYSKNLCCDYGYVAYSRPVCYLRDTSFDARNTYGHVYCYLLCTMARPPPSPPSPPPPPPPSPPPPPPPSPPPPPRPRKKPPPPPRKKPPVKQCCKPDATKAKTASRLASRAWVLYTKAKHNKKCAARKTQRKELATLKAAIGKVRVPKGCGPTCQQRNALLSISRCAWANQMCYWQNRASVAVKAKCV